MIQATVNLMAAMEFTDEEIYQAIEDARQGTMRVAV